LITPEDGQAVPKLDLQGACAVRARSSDVAIIVSRLLQWFVYRSKNVPFGIEPAIRIRCEEGNGGATVVFEDDSRRLPKKLREDLFAPFTQAISTPFDDLAAAPASGERGGERAGKEPPLSGRYLPLYLAKMLVEGRYRGILEDHSDEITDKGYGHRVLMYFPRVNAAV
jgi:hypothetical protein